MNRKKAEKQRLKRKAKQKQKRVSKTVAVRSEKLDYLIWEAEELQWNQQFDQALVCLKKALLISPKNIDLLRQLGYVGQQLKQKDVELDALHRLYELGALEGTNLPAYCDMLCHTERYEEAVAAAEEIVSRMPRMKMKNKREIKAYLKELQQFAQYRLALRENARIAQKALDEAAKRKKEGGSARTERKRKPKGKEKAGKVSVSPSPPTEVLPDIPITIKIDAAPLKKAWNRGVGATPEQYDIALDGYRIRLNETFDQLVCIGGLTGVRSLWYQEETAKKVLKRFRGRALLADEVGLGKTIEALIVFSEYYRRGMIKSGLILTPTPLVSQWQEELKSKFGLDIPSTDDADYRSKGSRFWQEPFILASINLAKSKKNYEPVTGREYDIVIVDEAHHLKNRNTLNWKLVNALKKKYLLMLTATPVENNLMELYNMITLLKPGQLKTASAFREEFMTRGDPTDPQNKEKLKDLLGAVMIRNTRALANIDIPPRFAQTIRTEATRTEKELYERITGLVRRINAEDGNQRKLLLKHLLAEAGSSPRAVSLTLNRMIDQRDLLLAHEEEIRAIENLCRSMDHTGKNRSLLQTIKANPGKIIVFVKYLGTMEHLSEFLSWERIPFSVFHGGMNNQEKDRQIDDFMQKTDILLTTEIGGEGRNLQFCHQMVNYDLPWNPMKIEQRIGRIHRLGQKNEVRIFNFCNADSIEDHILEILDKKINMFEMVIGEIDMILGRIRGELDFSDMVYDIWINTDTEAERKVAFDQLGSQLKRSATSYKKTKQLDQALFGKNYEL
ncbi:MAG: DEAD/DEAH box helicase family protein [Desulfobacterales bacterium]|nr:DEAD/DEAH box helicase family protein [Desulfobacterales bacterium]